MESSSKAITWAIREALRGWIMHQSSQDVYGRKRESRCPSPHGTMGGAASAASARALRVPGHYSGRCSADQPRRGDATTKGVTCTEEQRAGRACCASVLAPRRA
jgi:hypothetical protein